MIAAVILAAGASTRLGSPKQLLRIADETLLDRALRIARGAGCSPVVVVLGSSAALIRRECRLEHALVVVNDQWSQGMGASIRTGIAALRDSEGAVVLTCDMPAVTSSHLRALMASGSLTASHYADRNAVPAFFPKNLFPDLLRLDGDTGARTLLRSAPAIGLPGGELDVDTAGDLARLRQTFGE